VGSGLVADRVCSCGQPHRALAVTVSSTDHRADAIVPMMNCSIAALDSLLACAASDPGVGCDFSSA